MAATYPITKTGGDTSCGACGSSSGYPISKNHNGCASCSPGHGSTESTCIHVTCAGGGSGGSDITPRTDAEIKAIALQCILDNPGSGGGNTDTFGTLVQNNANTWTWTPAGSGDPVVITDTNTDTTRSDAEIKAIAFQCISDNEVTDTDTFGTFVASGDNQWTWTPAGGGTPVIVTDTDTQRSDEEIKAIAQACVDAAADLNTTNTDINVEIVDGEIVVTVTDSDGNTVTNSTPLPPDCCVSDFQVIGPDPDGNFTITITQENGPDFTQNFQTTVINADLDEVTDQGNGTAIIFLTAVDANGVETTSQKTVVCATAVDDGGTLPDINTPPSTPPVNQNSVTTTIDGVTVVWFHVDTTGDGLPDTMVPIQQSKRDDDDCNQLEFRVDPVTGLICQFVRERPKVLSVVGGIPEIDMPLDMGAGSYMSEEVCVEVCNPSDCEPAYVELDVGLLNLDFPAALEPDWLFSTLVLITSPIMSFISEDWFETFNNDNVTLQSGHEGLGRKLQTTLAPGECIDFCVQFQIEVIAAGAGVPVAHWDTLVLSALGATEVV